MKKYARIITLLLAVSLYTQLLACGDTVDDGSESVTTETTAPETEKPYLDNLGEYDFDGQDFTMLIARTSVRYHSPRRRPEMWSATRFTTATPKYPNASM